MEVGDNIELDHHPLIVKLKREYKGGLRKGVRKDKNERCNREI